MFNGSAAARVASQGTRVASDRMPHPAWRPARPIVRTGIVRARLEFDHLEERAVQIAYEVHGPLSAPCVVVLGGISAGRHVAPTPADPTRGWWPGVVGEDAALDPARHLIVGIEYLGGKTDDGLLRPVTSHDQARALVAVLDELGIATALLVGSSYGGMVALAFAELFPTRVERLVVLCAAHRTHPMATGIRSVQRAAAAFGAATGHAATGLALARALAMTTYRSPEEFEERFSPSAVSPGRTGETSARFPVEDYLEARGVDFARRFDVDRFVTLSESIDLHHTRPESLPARSLLVSFDTDALVPPWLVDELATRSGRCPERVTVPSLFGHDAFLKEVDEVSALLSAGALEVLR